jgi:molybdopterin molybdotransferase
MMIPVETALERVLAGLKPLPAETVPLTQAGGRVLAARVRARVAHPPLDVSAMDGWAVRAADLPGTLSIIGESAAGHPFAGAVGAGQAVRISTGAAVPDGADAVVMQEDCERDGDRVATKVAVPGGKHIRTAGNDFAVGASLLAAGTVLDARHIGLAAAMNLAWLEVRRRPMVAVLSTGDEIRMPGDPLGPAQIPGSNGPMLAALIEANGGEVRQLGIAGDDRESLAVLLAGARKADLLAISGGASVGDHDLVGPMLAEKGMTPGFWKVAMRPGKPLMHGHLHGMPVLGLPGNPVSAYVAAVLFLVPMLRALQGLPPGPMIEAARLGAGMAANDQRQAYLRASLAPGVDGMPVATAFASQDSAVLSGLAAADAMIIRRPQAAEAKAGEVVEIIRLG